MANHLHKQIRDAVKTALIGLASTGSRVYANRVWPLNGNELPALRVFLDEETAEVLSIHVPAASRTLALTVEACAKASVTLDDSLDQISKEVEIALAAGVTVGSATLVPVYAGMRYSDDLADLPVGVKRLNFSIQFEAAAGAPDVLI